MGKVVSSPDIAGGVLLDAVGITKAFSRTQALEDVDFSIDVGEVHALVGANGAGKSTLSKILCGHIRLDSGQIGIRSEPVRFASPRDALAAGVAMVTQETTLAPDLPVIENIFLPRMRNSGLLSRRALADEAARIIDSLGIALNFSLSDRVGDLSIADRQLVEVLKALAGDPDIIFFDEPTTSLSPYESELLFGTLARLAERGKGIALVSHRMEEIFEISDRVTVLREGQVVGAGIETSKLTHSALIKLMVGKDISDVYSKRLAGNVGAQAKPALAVSNLRVPPLVEGVTFTIGEGEIVGLGGLVGAGRTEVAEAIYGARPYQVASMELLGRPFAPHSTVDAIRAGVGFIGEDRRRQGIVPDFSVLENLLLVQLGIHRRLTWSPESLRGPAAEVASHLGVPADRLKDGDILAFSGGMQQKIILARSLSTNPKVLLLDEPTRGVDIETRSTIYRVVREQANRGLAVLWISSDFEELLGICDRVIVMSDGRSVADLASDVLNVEKLMMFAAPKSSSNTLSVLLERLVAQYGGTAFWAYLDEARIYCFDCATARDEKSLFEKGTVVEAAHSKFGALLATSDGDYVSDAEGAHHVLAVPLKTRRGHYFGHIGLALPSSAERPPRDEVADIVRAATTKF